jgi:hypothetical protein
MKILFVNHKQQQCGVYQFGKRFYDLAKQTGRVIYHYVETEDKAEFEKEFRWMHPDIVVYNWYPVTMPWLSEDMVTKRPYFKHYFIFHDGFVRQNFDKYLFSGAEGKDISFPKEKTAILPRPLFKYDGDYPVNPVPTFGSFGFGGWQKGFTRLVEIVNREYSEAVINIQMPFAYFGDRLGKETRKIAAECIRLNTNPGIKLNIDHKFLSNDDTLAFLAKNDINVFLYKSANQGLSSVVDYALSVKRPIALTNDSMFKHVYKPELDIETHTLEELIKQGTEPLEEFYEKWKPEKFSEEMDKVYEQEQSTY